MKPSGTDSFMLVNNICNICHAQEAKQIGNTAHPIFFFDTGILCTREGFQDAQHCWPWATTTKMGPAR